MLRVAPIAAWQSLPEPGTALGFEVLQPIVVGMACVENGIKPPQVQALQIKRGFMLAFPKVKL